jgi:hypothetical protein
VTQNYFDPTDARETKNGEVIDKYITADFLPGKIYGCRVVLTNVSSSHQRVISTLMTSTYLLSTHSY